VVGHLEQSGANAPYGISYESSIVKIPVVDHVTEVPSPGQAEVPPASRRTGRGMDP
jgi:hypothetical protein